MGRPKIEGLVGLNLRVLQTQLDALDALTERLRTERGDPGFNRTDLIRELLAQGIAAHEKKKR